MKGLSVFGRALLLIYFSLTIFGLVTGIGGGDARGFYLGLIILGVAGVSSARYLTKPRETPLDRGDICLHVVFVGWFIFLTVSITGVQKSVMVLVPDGYIAATFQGPEIREVFTEPGLYFKSPFASFKRQQRLLGYEVTLPGFTSDGVKVPVLVRASAAVSPENLQKIFRMNPEGAALAPIVEEALREAVARSATRYSQQDIDENRRNLELAVRDSASSDLKGHFVDLKEMKLAVFSPEDSVH
jgi:hypothetical protein